MIPALRAAGFPRAVALVLPLLACSCDAMRVSTPENPLETVVVKPAAVRALVADSWAVSVARDPGGLEALLEAPGGDGWLRLYHGDLAAAEASFRGPSRGSGADSTSARLGLARVHLARASFLHETAALHAEAAIELARYRRDHAAEVRPGAYDLIVAALAATATRTAGPPEAEVAAFMDAAREGLRGDRPGADLQVGKALAAAASRRKESADPAVAGPPDLLPEPYRARLHAAKAIAEGDRAASATLSDPTAWVSPDFVDPRGADETTGLRFESEFRDAVPVFAAARRELAQALVLASAIEGPGALVAAAVEAGWGGPLPASLLKEVRPSAGSLPAWAALFASPAVDAEDWVEAWGGDGTSFAERWEMVFGAGTRPRDSPMDRVDRLLRDAEARRVLLSEAITHGATPDGAVLVADLDLVRRVGDRVLRTRMADLVVDGHAAPAKRLGDRSLDPNPGSKGGAATSRETRVSYRNDRAFLVSLARCLHQAGQTGAALAYIHPLAKQDARLLGVEHYLGRLDAAGSIGVAGKASQL